MPDGFKPLFVRNDVEVLSRETCFEGFLKIEKLNLRIPLYQGGMSKVFVRELLIRKSGVGVLLYDAKTDKVLLVEQFRPGTMTDDKNGPWALELVAGIVDKKETDEEVAKREALEEAGVMIERLVKITEYYNSPGGSNEKLSLYCASFDATTPAGFFGLSAENEDIRTLIVPRNEALLAVESGRINNAMSIIALQWLTLNLAKIQTHFLAKDFADTRFIR